MKTKISTSYILSTISLLILSTCVIGYFWINDVYIAHQKEYDKIKDVYISNQKEILKKELNTLEVLIDNHKNNITETIKSSLQTQINNISIIAKNSQQDKLISILNDMNKNGYIISMYDKSNIYVQNEYISKFDIQSSLLTNLDNKFVYTIKDINGKKEQIISTTLEYNQKYISVFIIYSKIQEQTKAYLINSIAHLTYSQNGYYFISDVNGTLMLNPSIKDIRISDQSFQDKGKHIRAEYIKLALANKDGAFLSYNWLKPTTNKISPKISFVKHISDFGWVIGTGIYVDEIEDELLSKEKELQSEITKDIQKIVFVLIVSTFMAIFVLGFIYKIIENIFDRLNGFFYEVSTKSALINIDDIYYEEFKTLSKSINAMLEEKIKIQNQLEYINKELENRVENEVNKHREKELLLIQQSKLASMGEMIGNIAHQWRQPLSELSTIFMNINFKYSKNNLDKEYLNKKILQSEQIIEYMSNTIDDFRNFYHTNKIKNDFCLYQSCVNTINIMKSLLKYHHINYIINVEQDIYIYGCKNEFEQAILNIVSNAKDALIQNNIPNPMIKIYTLFSKDDIYLIIEDNGGGITVQPIEKIYEPYISTKHNSKGTGIGLYMSKIIIEKNFGFTLNCYNLENGARFAILFDKKSVKRQS